MDTAPEENGKKVLTMAEYIERESLINHVEDLPTWGADGNLLDREDVIGSIENRLAADVVPVRHAMWEVVVGSDGKEHMVCTGCRKQQDLTGVFSYCPNCGCRMDGGDDE